MGSVFMFGDCQYLCYMFGLSRSSARHSCLWCLATAEEIQLASADRDHVMKRTLQLMKDDYKLFLSDGKILKRAKFFNNVIDDVFFDIPLTQVCCPGLHITLGIVLKIFNMMETYAFSRDVEIALIKSQSNEMLQDDHSFTDLVQKVAVLKVLEKWMDNTEYILYTASVIVYHSYRVSV